MNLGGAQLVGVNLGGIDLTGATLSGVGSGGIVGSPLGLPTNWTLQSGRLIGPGAYLTGPLGGMNFNNLNLTGATFGIVTVATGATFSGTNLTNAVLAGSNFAGVDLSTAILTGIKEAGSESGLGGLPSAVPAGFTIVSQLIIGPDVDLSDYRPFMGTPLNLSGLNLTSANMSNAEWNNDNLTGTNLTSTNFTNATLTGATLTGATLTGVTWNNTTCPGGTNSSTYTPQTCVGH